MGSASGSASGCAGAAKDADRSQGRKNPTGAPCFGTGRMGKKDGSRVSRRSERMKTSKEGKGGI